MTTAHWMWTLTVVGGFGVCGWIVAAIFNDAYDRMLTENRRLRTRLAELSADVADQRVELYMRNHAEDMLAGTPIADQVTFNQIIARYGDDA
jgi:hypothetical protein